MRMSEEVSEAGRGQDTVCEASGAGLPARSRSRNLPLCGNVSRGLAQGASGTATEAYQIDRRLSEYRATQRCTGAATFSDIS